MILVDSSVWIDHLRYKDAELVNLLNDGSVVIHPFIIGELALGNLRQREKILAFLQDLPQVIAARDDEVLNFIEKYKLSGLGIGYIDAHLLVAARLSSARLWTRDKRLKETAQRLRISFSD